MKKRDTNAGLEPVISNSAIKTKKNHSFKTTVHMKQLK